MNGELQSQGQAQAVNPFHYAPAPATAPHGQRIGTIEQARVRLGSEITELQIVVSNLTDRIGHILGEGSATKSHDERTSGTSIAANCNLAAFLHEQADTVFHMKRHVENLIDRVEL